MALEHLTENQILDYLDGTRGQLHEHLESCPTCRETAAQYQRLYLDLKDETGFDLPTGFAASVAAEIIPQKESSSWFAEGILAAVLLLAGICAIIIFVDLSAVFKGAKDSLVNTGLGPAFISTTRAFLSGLGIQANTLAFAGLALLMVAVLDRLVFALRRGKTLFFV